MPRCTASASISLPVRHRRKPKAPGDGFVDARHDMTARNDVTCPRRHRSTAHQRAVLLPEPADRRLGGAEALRFRLVPAHHDDAAPAVVVAQGALHQPADAAVLQRDEAGGADQIALAQATFLYRGIVLGKAEMNPVELGAVDAAGPQHPDRQSIADLLQEDRKSTRLNSS